MIKRTPALLVLILILALLLAAITACKSNKPGTEPTALETGPSQPTGIAEYRISVQAGEHGALTADAESVAEGGTVIFTVAADEGYHLLSFTLNGQDKTAEVKDGRYTASDVRADLTATAAFEQNIPEVTFYSVTVEETENGTVAVSKDNLEKGESVTVTLTPDEHYHLAVLRVNGIGKTEEVINGQYVIENVDEDISVFAIFAADEYTVTFNTDGAGMIDAQTVDAFTTVSRPDNPAKEGFNFTGWFLADTEYDFETPVTADIELTAHWNVDPHTRYTVNHYVAKSGTATASDLLYKSEKIVAEIGDTTQAAALNLFGYTAEPFVQKTVMENNATVINIFYTRDPLVESFEELPPDGNYTYQAQGYQDSGKILLLDGKDTGYQMGYRSVGIWVVSDAHSGNAALKFKKDGYDAHTTIYIKLTDKQKAALEAGGDLSFWYKSAGEARIQICGVEIGVGAGSWTKVELTEEMLKAAKSGTLTVYMYDTWNEAEFYIDDIVAVPGVGYFVEHKCGDILLDREFVKAAVGSTTAAKAKDIFGFVASGSVRQVKVAKDNATVVTVNYKRDPLIESFEELPPDGKYTYQSQGYQDSGKILLLDGRNTGYEMSYGAWSTSGIWVVSDAHSGNAALKFKKWGNDRHTTIRIKLTAEQKAVLEAGGDLSFWYKSAGEAHFQICDVEIGVGAGDWTKVELTEEMLEGAKSGTLTVYMYDTWNEAEFYIDDIVAVSGSGYYVEYKCGDVLLDREFVKAAVGSTTAAKAKEIFGYVAIGNIEQVKVAEGNATVVTVSYKRDVLVESFEELPPDGNYTYQAQGFEDSGKILLLDGADIGYQMGYRSAGIVVVSDAHSGNAALMFKKDGYDTHTTIYIKLSEMQKAALAAGGDLSFWYKSTGEAHIRICSVEIGVGAGGWTKIELTEEMLKEAKSGTLTVYMYDTWNEAEFYIDDIVAIPGVGYYVEYKCGDLLLDREFVKAAVGSTTAAQAKEIFGYVAIGSIEQAKVAKDNATVVTVNYKRDPLVESFEELPLDGNYTYQSQGYIDSGKILLLDGENTGYEMSYGAWGTSGIWVVSDAHSGNAALKFKKWGNDRHTTIRIKLTDEQKAALTADGDLSFWYKSAGAASFQICGVEIGVGAGGWTKIELTEEMLKEAKSGTLTVYMYDTWNEAEFYIDDIVATPSVGYYVEHKCGDILLDREFVKAAVGSTTAAQAKEIFGYVAIGSIEQAKVAKDNATVVTVNYKRDPLVESFEELPLDGNYTYQAQGYQDSGKILLLDGANTGYSMGYNSIGIWVVEDGHTGKALKFQKAGADTHTRIYIKLTDEQKATIAAGGSLSFWYRTTGEASLKFDCGEEISAGAADWTQVILNEAMLADAAKGFLDLSLYGTWNAAELYIDDIVATPAA